MTPQLQPQAHTRAQRLLTQILTQTLPSIAAFSLSVAPAVRSETIALDFSVPNTKTAASPPALPQAPPPKKKAPVALSFDVPQVRRIPDIAADVAPGMALDITPKAAPNITSDVMPDIAPEAALGEPVPAPKAPVPVPAKEAPIAQTPKPLPPPPPTVKPQIPKQPQVAQIPQDWWHTESPLAIALGAAEGTRRYDGSKTPIYYWHTDPGNYADNFGTFSYQHLQPAEKAPVVAAKTAAAKRQISANLGLAQIADRRQLARIQKYYEQLRQQAFEKGIDLNQKELIAGLDLANQAPLAALNPMGYLDRLKQMRQLIDDLDEQILEARIWSYWHPQRNTWDAPGLGNTYDRIRHDQKRRLGEIEQALAAQEVEPQTDPPQSDRVAIDSTPPSQTAVETLQLADRPKYLAVTSEEAAKRPFPCMVCGF
ncbi:MAG: hypothetical protein SWY16_01350 [Cyanobacteriota bacterium]|nr:hypothetical protein [Cyanobacteriota bacterium]